MARGRVWQGIREWLRPVEHAHGSVPSRDASAEIPTDSSRIHDRTATRARVNAQGGAEVIPFPGGRAAEAVLDPNPPGLGTGSEVDVELLEFLAADVDPVPADPAFRERLRAELWGMIVDEQDDGPARMEEDV